VNVVTASLILEEAKVESPIVRRHSGSASLAREFVIWFIVPLIEKCKKLRIPKSGELQSTLAIPHDLQFSMRT
jgi:hypothetical protein